MKDLEHKVLKLIRHGRYTRQELSEVLGIDTRKLTSYLESLKSKGADIKQEQGKLYVVDGRNTSYSFVVSKASSIKQELVFIATSDWHIGSKQYDNEGLEYCMNKGKELGAEFALHSGDIVDGFGVYPGQLDNLLIWRFDDQIDLAVETLDKLNICTYGIGGNHDYSYTKEMGARPTKVISLRTNRFKDMGDFQADIIINGINIKLVHGTGGNAYSQSYPAQKYLRNLAEGTPTEVPDILLLGHFHTNPVLQLYGCIVLHPGNFQKQNDYMIRRGIRGVRGLYIVELVTQRGEILEYNTRFVKADI